MNQMMDQIRGYLRGIWRRRWMILILAWVVSVGSWSYIYTLENKYQAEARVHVNTQSLLKPLLGGMALQPNVNQQITMVTRTIVSRPNLEKLARMTDLDLRAKNPQQQEALYNNLASKITLNATGDNIYKIGYIDSNPDLAKRIVQALVTIFTESSLGGTRTDLSRSQKFIDDQLKNFEEKLNAKEQEISEFKRRNIAHMPGTTGGFYNQYSAVIETLERAAQELTETENRKSQLVRQLEDQEETLTSSVPITQATSAFDARITALQTQIDNLRLRYTDQHPDIARIKVLIASLVEQKKQEQQSTKKETTETVKSQNPIYQQLTISIAQTDAAIASLKSRVATLEKKKKELGDLVNLVPQIEIEYNTLMRDYSQHQKNFAQLLERHETASFTSEVETKTDSVDFRVIDPPMVGGKPVWPNRPLLVTAAPFGGLIVGVVLAFLLGQLRPTIINRKQLTDLTELPLLGSVTKFQTEAARIRERKLNYIFFAGLGVLFVAYLAQIVYYVVLSPAA